MSTFTLQGYAIWAGHLVNGDPSNLTDEEFSQMQRWLARHGLNDHDCLSAGDETFFGRPTGITVGGDCVEYVFCERE